MNNKKYNINIGNSNITIGTDVQSNTETLEYIVPPKIILNTNKSRYSSAVKDFVRGILKDNGINVKNDDVIEEIATATYEHFITLLQRENKVEFKEIEIKELKS